MKNRDIRLKTPEDIERIREAGKIIAEIFLELAALSLEGLSTLALDTLIEEKIHRQKARPSFKTVINYSHATCICLNDEVVHGIPSRKKIIKRGDIVKVDIGVVKKGYFADACNTYAVGPISEKAQKLMDVTREALYMAIDVMQPGNRLGDIGHVIQSCVEKNGFSIVRDFTGHGVGFAVHELPNVPHFGRPHTGIKLVEGMVLAIEPMVNAGKHQTITLEDGWTAVTADGRLSAQFEHTVAVTARGPLVLTA